MAAKAASRVPPRVGKDLPTESPALLDEAQISDVAIVGDYTGAEFLTAEITACRLDEVQAIGSRLIRSRLVDCIAVACDFSGAVFDECSISRMEFHDCRLSGLQAQHSWFKDVAFFDCKVEGANFRMTRWESAEFQGCSLAEADFYEASLPGSRFQSCDLTGVQLAKADLTGTRLHGSTLERIQGADGLRGVVIGSDQVLPAALAVFATLNIVIDDESNVGD
jgi:uncharacterized protein YjbI with pentapeptide repeats